MRRFEEMHMALESWGWFVQLVESGTFTRAADELQIPQQTLSGRLASLERELDELLVRGVPLATTRAGGRSSRTPASRKPPARACSGR